MTKILMIILYPALKLTARYSAFETWWHTCRNQISSFAKTDESI